MAAIHTTSDFAPLNSLALRSTASMRSGDIKRPRVIAIGGGKGGVGKSLVSTMFGIYLARSGFSTVIVDADFSGANIHGYLNMLHPETSIVHYLQRKTYDLNELAIDTSIPKLQLIPMTPGQLYTIQLKYWEKQKILTNIRKLNADYVLLDLGAGISYTTIDFFNCADDGLLVATCDPLCMHGTFGFIRAVFTRSMQWTFRHWPDFFRRLKECGAITQKQKALSLDKLLETYKDLPSSWKTLIQRKTQRMNPRIVLNMVHEDDSHHEMQALRLVVKELLNIDLSYWGDIRFDDQVKFAARHLKVDLLTDAQCKAFKDASFILDQRYKTGQTMGDMNGQQLYRDKTAERQHRPIDRYVQICNHRCLAWNCCDVREGGLACSKITPLSVPRSAA
jgi:flagellar biosynthesis protein FlhG